MKAYRDWAPTGFDCKGLNLDDRQDWLVVCVGTNRDADALTRSNWRAVTKDIQSHDKRGKSTEIHRFGHWACGWFEIMIVRPGSAAAKCAAEWESALADYPIASDDDFSNEEYEEANEVWANCYTTRQRVEYIREHHSEFDFGDMADLVACVRGKHFCGYPPELLR